MGLQDSEKLLVEKISAAANRFCAEEPDKQYQQICRTIEEKILTTPWNLSQSLLASKSQKTMMLLEGVGDPSFGHGGISYLRLPLKISSEECLSKAKQSRVSLNPAIQNPKQVTGTDADLRKLTKDAIRQKLVDAGHKLEELKNTNRWTMVGMLKEMSNVDDHAKY